ncbi:MAG: hypothetical protein LBP76_13960, partial [Treponema sp.]|nr:hypothetical protein [Treponema sp.]
HPANGRILPRTVTNHCLKSMGLPEMLERFEMLHERYRTNSKVKYPRQCSNSDFKITTDGYGQTRMN